MSDPCATLDGCLAELADNRPAEAVLQRLRPIESALRDDVVTRARFLRARAIATNRLGFGGEALGDLHEARRLLEGTEHAGELAEIFRAIATVFGWRGDSREAALALLRAIAEATAAGDRAALALALIEAGRLQIEIGRPGEAQALLVRALDAGASLPRREYQRAWVNLLQARVAAGQIGAAREQLGATAGALAQAHPRLLMLTELAAARVALKSGETGEAAAALGRARAHAPDAGDAFEHVEIAETEADLALARGAPQKASDLLETVIARYADDDLASREVPARLVHAKALEALGRAGEAERTLGAALRRALARGLTGHADEVRSRLNADRAGHRDRETLMFAATDADRRFVRQRPLGSGAFGKVLRAYDLELGFEVAIKRASRGEHYDPALRERLIAIARTELAAASRLDHPGIARVFGLLTVAGGDTLIVQEFVEGPTLREVLQGRLERARALDLLSHIAYVLAAVHGAGVIHRDLKPENIILRGGDAPVLIDFGVALLAGKNDRLQAGTLAYMAPEQAHGRIDARADLYALGVIAHELLTGTRPQPRSSSAFDLARVPGTPSALTAAGVEPPTAQLIGRLIAPHPFWRPRSAAEIGKVFAEAGKNGG